MYHVLNGCIVSAESLTIQLFLNRMPPYAERVYKLCGLAETVRKFTDETICNTHCQVKEIHEYTGTIH